MGMIRSAAGLRDAFALSLDVFAVCRIAQGSPGDSDVCLVFS